MEKLKKYYIKTFGCKLNQTDSREYEKILNEFLKPSCESSADIIFINSCGVIEKTENKILKLITQYKEDNKKVILGGCLPTIFKKRNFQNPLIILEAGDKQSLRKYLKQNLKTKERKFILSPQKSFSIPVAISSGCLGDCTYCAAKIARGKLKSKTQEKVLIEIKNLLKNGFKEIQLTSQDLAIFGMDRGSQELPELLKKIICLDGDFRVRLGMSNPSYIENIKEDLREIFKSEKIYNFLHIPVQSGSDKILKKMNRGYSIDSFKKLLSYFRKGNQSFLFSTDIIVGFPEEKEEDFLETFNLINDLSPHIVNITRFSARKGTPAQKMKEISQAEKKERSRKLFKLTKEIRENQNKLLLGKNFNALITEIRNGNSLARLPDYKAVILNEKKAGVFSNVTITDYKYNYLLGNVSD